MAIQWANPQNFRSFDLGNIMARKEQIQGMQIRNQLGQQQLDQQKRAAKNQQIRDQIMRQSENSGQAIRLMRAHGMHEQADAMQAGQIKQFNNTLGMLENASRIYTTEDSYNQLRSNLLNSGAIGPDDMPADFDKSFFSRKKKEVQAKLKQFQDEVVGTNKRGETIRRQRARDEFGNVLYEGPAFVGVEERRLREQTRDRLQRGREKKQEGQLGLKSSISGEIRRQVGDALGGSYDAITGRYTFKGENQRKAAQVIEDAERMIQAGRATSVGAAVAEALRRLGEPIGQTDAATEAVNILGLPPPSR